MNTNDTTSEPKSKIAVAFLEMLDANEATFQVHNQNSGYVVAIVNITLNPISLKGCRITHGIHPATGKEYYKLIPPMIFRQSNNSYVPILLISDIDVWHKLQTKAVEAYLQSAKSQYPPTNEYISDEETDRIINEIDKAKGNH